MKKTKQKNILFSLSPPPHHPCWDWGCGTCQVACGSEYVLSLGLVKLETGLPLLYSCLISNFTPFKAGICACFYEAKLAFNVHIIELSNLCFHLLWSKVCLHHLTKLI